MIEFDSATFFPDDAVIYAICHKNRLSGGKIFIKFVLTLSIFVKNGAGIMEERAVALRQDGGNIPAFGEPFEDDICQFELFDARAQGVEFGALSPDEYADMVVPAIAEDPRRVDAHSEVVDETYGTGVDDVEMRFVGKIGIGEGTFFHESIKFFDIDAVSDEMNLLEVDCGIPSLIDDIVDAAGPGHDDGVGAFVHLSFVALEEFRVPLVSLLGKVREDAFRPEVSDFGDAGNPKSLCEFFARSNDEGGGGGSDDYVRGGSVFV